LARAIVVVEAEAAMDDGRRHHIERLLVGERIRA
jgi:hypothetical protein